MFFVTYHGSKPQKNKSKKNNFNNIYAYDQNGQQLSSSILQPKNVRDLSELRGFNFFQSYLYVANGGKDVDNILCFSGSGMSYKEIGPFVTGQTVNSINHPFAMAFDANGHCFVSNQDTDTVTQLNLKAPPITAVAVKGAAASYLRKFDKANSFLDGTFVASSYGCLPNVMATTPVPGNQGGLDVAILSGKVQNSVRDIVLAGPGTPPTPLLLYVVDEPGNMIRMYDPVTGTPCGISNQVLEPTHLLVNNDILYVSAGNQILKASLCSAPGHSATDIYLLLAPISYTPPSDVTVDKLAFSGMAFDPDGNFYVAARTKDQIWKYPGADFTQPALWLNCPTGSAPEFIAYVGPDPQES
jgi:hypothetical protein